MSQRSLDEEDPPEDGSPEPEDEEEAEHTEEGSGPPDAPAPPPSARPAPDVPRELLQGPSDAALRERQLAWMQERARHEERRRPAPVDEGSK